MSRYFVNDRSYINLHYGKMSFQDYFFKVKEQIHLWLRDIKVVPSAVYPQAFVSRYVSLPRSNGMEWKRSDPKNSSRQLNTRLSRQLICHVFDSVRQVMTWRDASLETCAWYSTEASVINCAAYIKVFLGFFGKTCSTHWNWKGLSCPWFM